MPKINVAQSRDRELVAEALRRLVDAPGPTLRAASADDAEPDFFGGLGRLRIVGQEPFGVPGRDARGAHRGQGTVKEAAAGEVASVEHGCAWVRNEWSELARSIVSGPFKRW